MICVFFQVGGAEASQGVDDDEDFDFLSSTNISRTCSMDDLDPSNGAFLRHFESSGGEFSSAS